MNMGKPKIRFKGFDNDWEQRKLGDLVSIYDGVHQTPEYQDSGIMFLSVENIVTLKSEKYISEEAFERDYKVYPEKGDILMTRIGDVGTTNVVETVEKVAFYVSLALLKPNEIDSYFLSSAMKTNAFQKGLRERTLVTAIPQKINKDEIGKIDIFITNNDEEQQQIGAYFSTLDHLITLHQRKCEDTKKLKKYMLQKMFPQNGSKVPEIRFKGFTDDWEHRKLGDLLMSLQNNTLSRADLSNESGVAKNVHYGDVLIKFGEVLDISKEQLPMITDERVLSKYKASFLQNGDVIVADTAEDSTVGKCSEIVGLNDEVVLSGLHTIPYRPVENFASGYLGYYLNSDTYHNQLIPLMQGIKVTSISKSTMQDTDIFYPKSIEEQGKISNYLQSLDNLITLHQRECSTW